MNDQKMRDKLINRVKVRYLSSKKQANENPDVYLHAQTDAFYLILQDINEIFDSGHESENLASIKRELEQN